MNYPSKREIGFSIDTWVRVFLFQLARSAERYFAEMNLKRVPLPGLLYASMALVDNNAWYVSLKEPQISDDIMEFLSDVDISEEELANITNAIEDIYAVIKFTFDEIDQELRWKEIYESEWERFAISGIKNPDDSVLYIDVFTP